MWLQLKKKTTETLADLSLKQTMTIPLNGVRNGSLYDLGSSLCLCLVRQRMIFAKLPSGSHPEVAGHGLNLALRVNGTVR